VISTQKLIIFGHELNTPVEKYLLVLSIVVFMALAAKNMVRSSTGPGLDGGARYGCGGFGDRYPPDADQAACLCRQFLLLRRGRRALRLLLPRFGGTGRLSRWICRSRSCS
jgi:hypothetical protein